MGATIWFFTVDSTGRLRRVPRTVVEQQFDRKLKVGTASDGPGEVVRIEVWLEVNHRRPVRVNQVVAHRVLVDADGYEDAEAERRRGRRSVQYALGLYGGLHRGQTPEQETAEAIEQLQHHASYVFPLSDAHWSQLSQAIGLPLEHLRVKPEA